MGSESRSLSDQDAKCLNYMLEKYADHLQILQFNPWYSEHTPLSMLECDEADPEKSTGHHHPLLQAAIRLSRLGGFSNFTEVEQLHPKTLLRAHEDIWLWRDRGGVGSAVLAV